MDVVSHAIIGGMLVDSRKGKRLLGWAAFFSVLPDIFQIPIYLFLGYVNHRPFFFPLNSDWEGVRSQYPALMLWWEIPHSLLFWVLVIAPLVYFLKLPIVALWAYFFHLFVDLFTHTGEWGVKPFFPLSFQVDGFTDAWAWNFYYFPIAWAVLLLALFAIQRVRQKYQSPPAESREERFFCPPWIDVPVLAPGQRIKVMTWNIQFMAGKNYVFFYDVPGFRGKDRRPSAEDIAITVGEVARVVRDEQPDLLLLQEVDDGARRTDYQDQLASLLAQLPDLPYCHASTFYWKSAFIPYPKIWGRVGIKLVVLSKYQISRVVRRPVSNLKFGPFLESFMPRRAVLEARLPIENGAELAILNTHLEAFVVGTNVLHKQVQEVQQYLDQLGRSDTAWVFGGDLNLLPEGQYQLLADQQKKYYNPATEGKILYDRYRMIPSKEDLRREPERWLTYCANDPSIPEPDRTLDYLLYSNRLKLQNSYVRQHDTTQISDHFPVIGVFDLPE